MVLWSQRASGHRNLHASGGHDTFLRRPVHVARGSRLYHCRALDDLSEPAARPGGEITTRRRVVYADERTRLLSRRSTRRRRAEMSRGHASTRQASAAVEINSQQSTTTPRPGVTQQWARPLWDPPPETRIGCALGELRERGSWRRETASGSVAGREMLDVAAGSGGGWRPLGLRSELEDRAGHKAGVVPLRQVAEPGQFDELGVGEEVA